MASDEYISLQEAASLLNVTTQTLRNWDKAGKLRAFRNPANRYRTYRLRDVAALQHQPTLFPVSDHAEAETQESNRFLTASDLRRIVRALHRILRDCEGNSSLIERFDEMTKILYCKVHDENQLQDGDRSESSFRIGNGDTERKVADRIHKAFAAQVERTPQLFPKRFAEIRLQAATIFRVVELLAPVELSHTSEDLKGLVYEEVIKNTFVKGDNQQFFTPRTIVEFMVEMLGPALNGTVCDPACGTGGFLLYADTFLKRCGKHDKVHLLGCEIDERLGWSSGINLDMHGARDFSVRYLSGAGSLGESLRECFGTIDAIITNPPFGSDFSDAASLAGFQLGKGKTSRRRGVLFIERCLDLLKPGGVVGIIIDDAALNGPTNSDVRQLILERSEPFAIISLPETAFMPYASVKASILFLQKKGSRRARLMHKDGTFFAKAEVVGRKPNGEPLLRINKETGRQELDSDLPSILQLWQTSRASDCEDGISAFFGVIPSLTDTEFIHDGSRLDHAYHHPSRHEAALALQSTGYPLLSVIDICDVRNDQVVPSKELEDEEISYIGLANIEVRTGVCTPAIISGASLKSTVKRFVAGDILFAKMRPELRKVCLVPDDIDEGYASAECLVLVPRTAGDGVPIMLSELITVLLRSDLVYGQLGHLVIGIGRPRLNKSDLLKVRLPVPPVELQRQFLELYKRSENASQALLAESQRAVQRSHEIMAKAERTLVESLLAGAARGK